MSNLFSIKKNCFHKNINTIVLLKFKVVNLKTISFLFLIFSKSDTKSTTAIKKRTQTKHTLSTNKVVKYSSSTFYWTKFGCIHKLTYR